MQKKSFKWAKHVKLIQIAHEKNELDIKWPHNLFVVTNMEMTNSLQRGDTGKKK
jgi:hypothetical protein